MPVENGSDALEAGQVKDEDDCDQPQPPCASRGIISLDVRTRPETIPSSTQAQRRHRMRATVEGAALCDAATCTSWRCGVARYFKKTRPANKNSCQESGGVSGVADGGGGRAGDNGGTMSECRWSWGWGWFGGPPSAASCGMHRPSCRSAFLPVCMLRRLRFRGDGVPSVSGDGVGAVAAYRGRGGVNHLFQGPRGAIAHIGVRESSQHGSKDGGCARFATWAWRRCL